MISKEKYKNTLNDVSISKEAEDTIINTVLNRAPHHHHFFKLAYVGIIASFIFIFSLTIVYADEIKEFIVNGPLSILLDKQTNVEISNDMGFVKIKEDALKTNDYDGYTPMSVDEAEKTLGIKLLRSDKSTSDDIGYGTGQNKDGTIGRVDLWQAYFIEYTEDKTISLAIHMLNENADKGYILAMQEGFDAGGEKEVLEKYNIAKLGVNAIIYGNQVQKNRISATFVYKNIGYHLIGRNISKQEMIDVLNSLK